MLYFVLGGTPKTLLGTVKCCELWELNLTLKHAQSQRGTMLSPWQLGARRNKRVLSRWVTPLLLDSMLLAATLTLLALICTWRTQSSAWASQGARIVPAWVVFTCSYLCPNPHLLCELLRNAGMGWRSSRGGVTRA